MSFDPARLDLDIYEHATWSKTLTLHTGDSSSAVTDLTGYTATFTVKDTEGGTTLMTLTNGSGVTLGGTAGTITLTRTLSEVTAITWSAGVYELTLTSAGGIADVLIYGQVKVVRF